jgi:decaprenyl-phosphate phosphoribosyltransferase
MPAWLRALRPKQWVKNVLVLAAPFAGGVIARQEFWPAIAAAFGAFCLVSSAIYITNDIRDAEADRAHPVKSRRPFAAGELRPAVGWAMAAALLAAGLALAALANWPLFAVLASYVVLQALYVLWLKRLPILDIALVCSGFLLRALAGVAACNLELSQWFLLVASFGSLFVVAGKRYSELKTLGAQAGTRHSLEGYTPSFLRTVWAAALAIVTVCYSLWAFEQTGNYLWGVDWPVLSIAPFTLALLRYGMAIDAGKAEEPENVAFRDHMLQILALIWLAILAIAILMQ